MRPQKEKRSRACTRTPGSLAAAAETGEGNAALKERVRITTASSEPHNVDTHAEFSQGKEWFRSNWAPGPY